jgi:hypothetical protein
MIMQAEAEVTSSDRARSEGTPAPEIHRSSRYNALKHGLTARIVLPWEDEEQYDARLVRYKTGLPVRSELEEELAERAAQASWMMDRAMVADNARVTSAVLDDPDATALREESEAEALGNRLLFDCRGPTELYGLGEYEKGQARTSWSEDPDDPNSPKSIVRRMESTRAGCRRLINEWGEMREILTDGLGWQSEQKFKAVRLLGKQPLAVGSSRLVARIFLACHVIEPQFSYAFQELRCEIHEDRFKKFQARLARRNLAEITPKDPTEARAVLLGIVDKAVARLEKLEAKHQKKADALAKQRAERLSHDGSKAGEQIHRHFMSYHRMVHRNIEAVKRARQYEAEGWGVVREARERRKAERRGFAGENQLVVIDERGTLRPAEGYTGDLDQGLARYAERMGEQPIELIEAERYRRRTAGRSVPDFARWRPPVGDGMPEEGGGRSEDGTGGTGDIVEDAAERQEGRSDAEFRNEEGDRVAGDGVPLILTDTGEGACFQNEMAGADCERSECGAEDGTARGVGDIVECAAERPEGRSDAERRNEDGGRTAGDGVPLMLTQTGEGARFQNEMAGADCKRGECGAEAGAARRTEEIVELAEERQEGRSDAEPRNEGSSVSGVGGINSGVNVGCAT